MNDDPTDILGWLRLRVDELFRRLKRAEATRTTTTAGGVEIWKLQVNTANTNSLGDFPNTTYDLLDRESLALIATNIAVDGDGGRYLKVPTTPQLWGIGWVSSGGIYHLTWVGEWADIFSCVT